MRFAWIRENTPEGETSPAEGTPLISILRGLYNAVFWIFLLPFIFANINYSFGFVAFSLVILVRLVINLYVNNFQNFTPQKYESYPFRIP